MTPEEKAEEIKREHMPLLKRCLETDLNAIIQSREAKPVKYIRLREISDQLNATVKKHTPCRRGCSGCCHLATSITQHEAEIIGRYTGRKPRKLPETTLVRTRALIAMRDSIYGTPCTFLKNDECSIYPARPLQCRLHHSLMEDARPCSAPLGTIVAKFDFRNVERALTECESLHSPIGDIREFFPLEAPCGTEPASSE